jgi:DNA-binding NarL/FixJ family response regulator
MNNLMKAIRTVASGAIYLSAEMSYQIADATSSSGVEGQKFNENALQRASLSAREQEVIRCYLAGMTVTEIANKFNRSMKTISAQKAAAYRKLGVTSNNGLFKVLKGLS